MRAADAATIRGGTSADALMESAAEALCGAIERCFPDWARVAVVCGPGNNGGDGLAAARMLVQRGVAVSLFCLGDPAAYRGIRRSISPAPARTASHRHLSPRAAASRVCGRR